MSTRPASENVFETLRMAEAAAPPTPPSAETVLYTKSDGRIYWKDDAATEYSVASLADIGGSAALDDLTDVNAPTPADGDVLTFDNGSGLWIPAAPPGASISTLDDLTDVSTSGAATDDVLTYNGSSWAPAAPSGGGGSSDPVADAFGTPDAAYEFDANDFTGLTSFGTPDVASMHVTAASHLVLADDDSTQAGYYAAASGATTAICKISDFVAYENYQYVGMIAGVAAPGRFVGIWLLGGASPSIVVRTFNSPGDGSAGAVTITRVPTDAVGHAPWYFGIRVASGTDFSYYVSRTGVMWQPLVTAHNPSLGAALGSFGLSVGNYAGGSQPRAAGAYDYLRIWNSAKTFPAFS